MDEFDYRPLLFLLVRLSCLATLNVGTAVAVGLITTLPAFPSSIISLSSRLHSWGSLQLALQGLTDSGDA